MVTITGIGPCPRIQRGKGRVVTMTVTHFNGYVWELEIASADKAGRVATETLCPTDVHKLFSASRNGWVMAKDLRVGEALRTQAGVATITSAKSKGGIHRVYNFEVEQTHQYFVGNSRTLSHNMDCAVTTSGTGAGTVGEWTFTPGRGPLPKPTPTELAGRPTFKAGDYTVNPSAMDPHMTGSLASGKSQWGFNVDAYKATLDAANIADKYKLWVGNKAKVPASGIVGSGGSTGAPSDLINVYRRGKMVHGCPGNP